jgi:hypothetical protein
MPFSTGTHNSVATELTDEHRAKKRTKRHVAHRASPRHCHACARCPAPCTRAHACRARSSRTHHACAPRHSHAHALTQQHALTSKSLNGCSSHRPLADCRPARCMRIWLAHALQMRSPPPLLVRRMRRSHAVHAMHHHRCHMCREMKMKMKTMNEMKTNDTMKKTKDTTDDARECAPLVPALLMRNGALASTPRESTSRALATARAAQATATALAIPRANRLSASVSRPQLAANDARSSRHRQEHVVGRLGGGGGGSGAARPAHWRQRRL